MDSNMRWHVNREIRFRIGFLDLLFLFYLNKNFFTRNINSSHIFYYDMNSLPNSGNINIDKFIGGAKSIKNKIGKFLEWVPFKEFKDVKKIGQGGSSQIFKANWKINEGISGKD
ncbi:hypothetical protein Glove_346g162 [Diversispora epigaea]|uniref:Protein kinase domain-containing protein n=1 Tax=Diversispora epigaea TaxID=1348612 RepID=A0A397HJU7_9GLOM|nr:hypothetical protein Glove_346g162 [Diversispora epigaea]